MAKLLEFVHASANATEIPDPVRRWLDDKWEIKTIGLDAVASWKKLPAFIWLDLGKISNPPEYAKYWETLAYLQKKSDPLSPIMISGVALSPDSHDRVVRDVFHALRPFGVEVDLEGKPDLLAVLAKWQAVRQEPSTSGIINVIHLAQKHRQATKANYVEVPNADIRTDSGNLSAKTIADLFGVTLTEVGAWIGRKKAALSKTPDSKGIQPLLEPLAQIAFYRKALEDDAMFRKWLRTEHELLQQQSPLHWIKAGKVREVAEFVEDALTGQPT